MATAEGSSDSSQALEFSRFSELPPELRTHIWQHALNEVTFGRIIRVAIHHWVQATQHSCLTVHGCFCGQHSLCSRYSQGEPSHVGYCMTNGYFATTRRYQDPEEDASRASLVNLGLACHESRHLIVSQYPKLLRVYRGRWRLGCESKFVRCSPGTDLLVITETPDYSHLHIHPDQQPHDVSSEGPNVEALSRIFPPDAHLFSRFRDILSSFRHVGIHYTGNRRRNLLSSTDFKVFLIYLESLEHLYVLWPDPAHWPDVHRRGIKLDDVQSLPPYQNHELLEIKLESQDLLEDYARYSQVQIDHSAPHDEHWVPRPKRITRVGCYSARSWLLP